MVAVLGAIMRKKKERVEVVVAIYESRAIPCVCPIEMPDTHEILLLRKDGPMPVARVRCQCGKTWTRVG